MFKLADVLSNEVYCNSYFKRSIDEGLGAEPPAAGGYWGLVAKPPAAGRFFVVFWKKKAVLTPLDHILLVFRAI